MKDIMNRDDVYEMCKQISEYTSQENDEFQEVTDYLIRIAESYPDYMEDETYNQILKELQAKLKYYQLNTKWVEEEQKVVITRVTDGTIISERVHKERYLEHTDY